jgi:hypothetical protein
VMWYYDDSASARGGGAWGDDPPPLPLPPPPASLPPSDDSPLSNCGGTVLPSAATPTQLGESRRGCMESALESGRRRLRRKGEKERACVERLAMPEDAASCERPLDAGGNTTSRDL